MANATEHAGQTVATHRPVEKLIHVIRGQNMQNDSASKAQLIHRKVGRTAMFFWFFFFRP
jgi:hypothetical protein